MFLLCQMCDTVRIAAHALGVPTRIAIEHSLNK
jgi:predicted metal-binding protein